MQKDYKGDIAFKGLRNADLHKSVLDKIMATNE